MLLVPPVYRRAKQFEYYEDWEEIAVALGPAVILGNEYLPAVNDFLKQPIRKLVY